MTIPSLLSSITVCFCILAFWKFIGKQLKLIYKIIFKKRSINFQNMIWIMIFLMMRVIKYMNINQDYAGHCGDASWIKKLLRFQDHLGGQHQILTQLPVHIIRSMYCRILTQLPVHIIRSVYCRILTLLPVHIIRFVYCRILT